jgi:hypothetical protein
MTVTARYLAWTESFTPSARHHLGLAVMETALLLAWALLLDSIIRFATSAFLNLLPITYLLAANLLAWLEDPSVSRMADPMTAKGIAEVDSRGRLPPRWRTLLRLLLTPPSFLILLVGFLPVLRGRRSLPEVASGVRLVHLDPSLDPRPIALILEQRRRNRRTVLGYTVLSLAIAALIVLLPLDGHGGSRRIRETEYPGLDEHERELLSLYLDMTTQFPDSLEFHVRLASLYYRNDMPNDLRAELDAIQRIDPANPMLLLRQDLRADSTGLLIPQDTFPSIGELGFGPPENLPGADSLGSDSLATDGADTAATAGPSAPPQDPGTPSPQEETPQSGQPAPAGLPQEEAPPADSPAATP